MNNTRAEKSRLGLIPIALFLINALLITVFLVAPITLTSIPKGLGGLLIYVVPVIASLGIVTGLMALLMKRAWVGLVLNLVLAIFIGLVVFWAFTMCCQPPPIINN